MIYKELEEKHIGEIAELYVRTFNAKSWNDSWTIESATKRLLQMLHCDGFYGIVCYENDKLIGLILGNHEYYYSGMHFNIKEVCIDVEMQGKGFGTSILEEFLSRLKKRGISEVYLFTSKEQAGFYNKNGFEEFGLVLTGKKL